MLAGAAAVIGVIVGFAEASYWLSHPHRSGPAAYVALSALGIVLLAVALLIRSRE